MKLSSLLLLLFASLALLTVSCGSSGGGGGGGGTGGAGDIVIQIDFGSDITFSGDKVAASYYTVTPVNSPVEAGDTGIQYLGSSASIMVIFVGDTAGTYLSSGGETKMWYQDGASHGYMAYPGMAGTDGTIIVTTYGLEGEDVVGTFTFTAQEYTGTADNATFIPSSFADITGTFTALILADDLLKD